MNLNNKKKRKWRKYHRTITSQRTKQRKVVSMIKLWWRLAHGFKGFESQTIRSSEVQFFIHSLIANTCLREELVEYLPPYRICKSLAHTSMSLWNFHVNGNLFNKGWQRQRLFSRANTYRRVKGRCAGDQWQGGAVNWRKQKRTRDETMTSVQNHQAFSENED